MPDTGSLTTYVMCVLATGALGWWLWRSWRGADEGDGE